MSDNPYTTIINSEVFQQAFKTAFLQGLQAQLQQYQQALATVEESAKPSTETINDSTPNTTTTTSYDSDSDENKLVIDEPTDENATQFLEQFNNDLQVSTPDEKQAGDEPKADADGKYECPICHKKYSRRWYIKGGHMRMHLQIKPFSCARCSKTFNDRSNCRAHERICDRKYARNQ